MTSHPINLIRRITDNLTTKGYSRLEIAAFFKISQTELDAIYPVTDSHTVDLGDNLTITFKGNEIISGSVWCDMLDSDLDCTEILKRDAEHWINLAKDVMKCKVIEKECRKIAKIAWYICAVIFRTNALMK